ncbi:MAG TPA: serine/threonine-protein kinase [Polyangiaceae bacterium]|nr:serine/threonine-protein kinase [Polyangiaceae bacterium]
MSSSDAPFKSRRADSITIPSLIDEEEPSLSTLGRPDLQSSSASASRERSARWGAVPWGSIAGSAQEESQREVGSGATLPSVCPTFVFARDTLVAERYVIRRFLGRGGMGQVYEAYDRVLQEPVALKTTTSQTPSDAQRLLDEVRMARRITHANVCRLYDAGVHEQLEPERRLSYFLTMEYLEGHTLRRRLRHGLPPLPQVFGIARQLLIGLAAVHAAGVLHRDFKSENVMLRLPGNGTGQAVIMDFGLARPLSEEEPFVPAGGAGAGSRGYMAPEQIENLPLGPETDLFAFGVVMFEMLTGRLPFARDATAMNAPNLLDQIPTPPSQLRPELPPELDAFVLKCLQAHRQHRYRSAQRALTALTRLSEELARRNNSGWSWALGHGFPRRGDRFLRTKHLA